MPAKKKPDKRTEIRRLADQLAHAYVAELEARKKFQDVDAVRFGARTPTQEDRLTIEAAARVCRTKTATRMTIEAEIANLLGITAEKKTPPGDILDRAGPDSE